MYTTALKTIKDQFGEYSIVARAFIDKLTKGDVIRACDRQRLRDFSIDIINCLATLRRMNYLADANTTETLRHIVRRLPDQLILKWKGVATEIRERGQCPTLEHINKFPRKVVKAEFDQDFGDMEGGYKPELKFNQERKEGIHSNKIKCNQGLSNVISAARPTELTLARYL